MDWVPRKPRKREKSQTQSMQPENVSYGLFRAQILPWKGAGFARAGDQKSCLVQSHWTSKNSPTESLCPPKRPLEGPPRAVFCSQKNPRDAPASPVTCTIAPEVARPVFFPFQTDFSRHQKVHFSRNGYPQVLPVYLREMAHDPAVCGWRPDPRVR